MNYLLHILIDINIYIILAAGSGILIGWANLLSMGQAAFYGIGAYFTAFSVVYWKLPLLWTLLVVILACGIIAFLIALPLLRLQADYFILGTIGFQMITLAVMNNCKSITNGSYGISGIHIKTAGITLSGILPFFFLSTIIMALVLLVVRRLSTAPFGRALRALRDDEVALRSLGRNTRQLRILAFVVSATIIGLAGLLYAGYVGYIDPTSFNLDESVFILSALIIGGLDSRNGPVLGVLFVILLPELLRLLGLPTAVAAAARQVIYGLLLIVLMRLQPAGLAGIFKLK